MRRLGVLLALLVLSWACGASCVGISVDLAQTHPVSKLLYGIFFEEINHAGEGGLYAELIQDRSFDALAVSNGFNSSEKKQIGVSFTLPIVENATRPIKLTYNTEEDQKSKMGLMETTKRNEQPAAWKALNNTKVFLTKEDPLTANNQVALNITTSGVGGGISNGGYWGIPVEKKKKYHFSVFIKGDTDAQISIRLQSKNGSIIYAEALSEGMESYWQQFTSNLTASETDYDAELALMLHKPGSIVVDSLSLFPMSNYRYNKDPYPFRSDLLDTLKSLRPRFLRFPGGCYVEGGDWLRNRFPWKTNLGPNYNRTGHLNQIWGYWSTDGLGLYEYMLLADELKAEPIYVINNGISHQEATPPQQLKPYIDETMDALEFLMGNETSPWGAMRVKMGKRKPWKLTFLAIGNEDCWRPYYKEDYNAFYNVIKSKYPGLILISNCDLGTGSRTELYDWHTYDDSQTMFNRVNQFDNVKAGIDAPVFVSEYAVTADGGLGNLRAAVAEAAFMTGMERNSAAVLMAAYAPLFTRQEARSWSPDMIVFDGHRHYFTPSYLVQELFARFQGDLYAKTEVQLEQSSKIAASTTCLDKKCLAIAVKIVNFELTEQTVDLSIKGIQERNFGLGSGVVVYSITGDHPEDENSFENPKNVKLVSDIRDLLWSRQTKGGKTQIEVPGMSVTLLALKTNVYHSTTRRALESLERIQALP